MTESSTYSHLTIASTVQPNTNTITAPNKPYLSAFDPSAANDAEEDDSTIKCICGFQHDDGSSVFCEKCKTWQHTECYYYDEGNERVLNKDELDRISHFCTDCRPRPIKVHAAITRQKARMGPNLDQDDKKAKKPQAKSHKKKTKGAESNGLLTNGWTPDTEASFDRTSRSPRDQIGNSKRPKTHHRPSQSLGLSAFSQNPVSQPHKRSASALQSPTKYGGRQALSSFVKENYSDSFMHLYDNDPGDQSLHTNLLSNISITQKLSQWAFDVEALKEATRGFSHAHVFHRIEQPLENIMGPPPRKQSREESRVLIDHRHPRWIYLTSDGFTKQNTIVGELKGKIGHMTDYINDPHNRWDWLRHPAPFVFFHPKLPIYIDTRSEGTTCRYLRRSCSPNLSMTTFLENDSEYHFCFTAKEDIESGAELTIGWTPDEHIRKFSSNKNDITQDLSAEAEEYFTDWVGKVSPEFGGCACGSPESCWIVRYDPECKVSTKVKGTQGRRKQQPNPQDSSDGEDAGSTSQSNSGSRAHTPTGHHSGGTVLGLDISEREKRKIALLEKNVENDKHQPATKKKKRNSGGSSANPHGFGSTPKPPSQLTASVSLPNTPGLPSKPQYVDASTSGRKSGSPTIRAANGYARPRTNMLPGNNRWSQPNTPTNPSPLRSNYVSTGVQTDPDVVGDWYQPTTSPNIVRKPFISMTKRLLLRSQRDRQMLEERRLSAEGSPAVGSTKQDLESNVPTGIPVRDGEDFAMPVVGHKDSIIRADVGSDFPPGQSPRSPEPKAPPWPSREQVNALNGARGGELRVQLPTKTISPSESSSSTPITQTPYSAILQSPYTQFPPSNPLLLPPSTPSVSTQPSPAKKKIQLSDYIKRKSSHSTDGKAGAGSPEVTHRSLKSQQSILHGELAADGSAIVDSPRSTPKKEDSNPLDLDTMRMQEETKGDP